MLFLVAQTHVPLDDAMSVACGGLRTADTFSSWACVAAVGALGLTLAYRARVATAGQHGLWAAVALLLGICHVMASMWVVPMGCLTPSAFVAFVGYASPWLLAAMLLRAAVAPTPDALLPTANAPPKGPTS